MALLFLFVLPLTHDQAPDGRSAGHNRWVDASSYGVRGVSPNVIPAIPGIIGDVTKNSTSATNVSSPSSFEVGDGVVIYGAGATNTMSTPGAPTVTPSVSASETGSLLDVAAPTGATSYAYQIVARDIMGGLTAASASGTTTKGASSLGMQTAAVSTITMSGNIVTVATTAPHGLVTGGMFVMSGVTPVSAAAPNPFNGWFIVGTVPDNKHFTYLVNSDTRNAAPTSGSGGMITSYNCNHITWSAVKGAYQYYIYGRTSRSLALIGVSWPQNATLAGDPTYLAFDDFGSTVTTYPTPPSYVPRTPPTLATNDMLATTVTNISGTTLTLANPSIHTVNGATFLFDDAVTFLKAANAASGSSVLLPYGGSYVFNSPITLPSGTAVLQEGTVYLNETVNFSGVAWRGATDKGSLPQFAYAPYPLISIGKANPGMYSTSNTYMYNLTLSNASAGGANMVVEDANGIPSSVFINTSFSLTAGEKEYSNIGLVFRGTHTASTGGSVAIFENTLFSSSQNGNLTACFPAFYANNFGPLKFTDLYLSGKGILYRPPTPGGGIEAEQVYSQANYEPFFALTNALGGGIAGVGLIIDNVNYDTTSAPLVANLGGLSVSLAQRGATGVAGGSVVTGVPTTFTSDGTSQNMNAQYGSNPTVFDGVFYNNVERGPGSVAQYVNDTSVSIGAGFSFFTLDTPPPAPTCSVKTAGPPHTSAGTWTFKFAWQYYNGGTGNLSPASTSCSANGTSQQIIITLPSTPSAAGARGALIYASRGPAYVTIGNFTPTTTTQTFTFTTFTAYGAQTGAGSGPAGMGGGNVWGNHVAVGIALDNDAPQTTVSCSISGTVTFSQPQQGSSYKQVVVYANACKGSASYIFPMAFSHRPQVLSERLSAIASSVSTTSITITGTTSTGFLNLDGF